MDMNTLLDLLEDAVILDEDAQTYARVTYDADLTVQEGIDMRNPPQAEECPLVVIYPGEKQAGLNAGVKSHIINVEVLVYDAETDESEVGAEMFMAGRRVEALRQYIFAAIKGAVPSDGHLESVSTVYDTIGQFPYAWCGMQLDITQEKLIGQDPYE